MIEKEEQRITDPLSLLFDKKPGNGLPSEITEKIPGIIYVYDPERKRLANVNKGLQTILGYDDNDISAWENGVTSFVYKDDIDLVKSEIDKYNDIKDDFEYSYDCRLTHKKGDWKYFRTTGKILRRNKNGKPASILFIAQDITEQKKSEQELKRTTELLQETEKLLNYGLYEWDVKTGNMKWSQGLYSIFGYDPPKTAGDPDLDFYLKHIPKEDLPFVKILFESAGDEKKDFHAEHFIESGKGEKRHVIINGKHIINDEGHYIKQLGSVRDDTEKNNLLNELLVYKQNISEQEEILQYGTWTRNTNEKTIYWSRGMYILFGYNPDNPEIGTEITEDLYRKHAMSEEDLKRLNSHISSVFDSGHSYVFDFNIKDFQGREKTLESSGKIIRDKEGKAVKLVGTTRDVTRIRNYEETLEQKIAQLYRSNKELEEFAYAASHDLHEPLRKIGAFGERLQEKFKEHLPEEAKTYLDRMMKASQTMGMLIDSLLHFSRVTRSTDTTFVKENIGTIVNELEEDFKENTNQSSPKLVISSPLPSIECVPVQIKQLFWNLFSNSVKFKNESRNLVIHIETTELSDEEKIKLFLKDNKKYYRIRVSDNGIGFESRFSEKIFSIFQRLHGKSEYPGSGIGLAICKKITENHKGIIFATGEPDKGAVITIILPEKQ